MRGFRQRNGERDRNVAAPMFLLRSAETGADYGVVPVENSTEGVVTHTLDMFVDSDLKIVSRSCFPSSIAW